MRRTTFFLIGLCAAGLAAPAHAAPEEIQVYMDEINDPGEIGLDLHLNYVPVGERGSEYPGAQPSLDRLRYTPEVSIGLPERFELGIYPTLGTIDPQGGVAVHGIKGRLKWLGPVPKGAKWWWGANFEIGHEDRSLSANPGNAEFKAMLGARFGRWTLAGNLNADFVVAGREPTPLAFDLDTRISYQMSRRLQIGVEAYDGLGTTRDFGSFARSEQSVFAVMDVEVGGGWGLNLGLGHGFTANRDDLIMKAIVSVPVGRKRRD